MNKLAKGAIAGAAGVALLLGGAGTFAYWNSSVGVAGGTVTAGDLKVVDDGTPGVWKDHNGNTINIATYKIVPDETITYTDDLNVTALGNNLTASLTLVDNAITAKVPGNGPDDQLALYLTKTATITATGSGLSGTAPNYVVTAGANGVSPVVHVSVALTFPKGVEAQYNDAKTGAVSLSNFQVKLTQIVTP